jgi:hypothetical protein
MEFAPIEGPHGFGASVTCGSGVQLGSLSPHQVATICLGVKVHRLSSIRRVADGKKERHSRRRRKRGQLMHAAYIQFRKRRS